MKSVSFLNWAMGLALVLAATAGTASAVDLPGAPEINPASAGSAIALLAGGMMLLVGRFRGK
jgi:hypothetical protein